MFLRELEVIEFGTASTYLLPPDWYVATQAMPQIYATADENYC